MLQNDVQQFQVLRWKRIGIAGGVCYYLMKNENLKSILPIEASIKGIMQKWTIKN